MIQANTDCDGFNTPAFFQSVTPDEVYGCIEKGADFTSPDENGLTPLFHAVAHATTPLVINEILIATNEAGVLEEVLDHQDRRGRTAMHVAAAEAHDPAMMTWLVAWGASVWSEFDCGEGWLAGCSMPIHLAAQRPDGFPFVATLLALGSMADPIDRRDKTPADLVNLSIPARKDVLALLSGNEWPNRRESRPAISTNTQDPLPCDNFISRDFFAVATPSDVAVCLADDAYPTATDRNGNTAIHLAAAYTVHSEVIDLLMRRLRQDDPEAPAAALHRTNSTNVRSTPLHMAAQHSKTPEVITRLVAWGTQADTLAEPIERRRLSRDRGTTALHFAAKRTDEAREAIITALLASGASTLQQDHGSDGASGRQALHYAAAHSPDIRVVELLQQAQAHQESLVSVIRGSVVKDDRGRTALHIAAGRDAGLDILSSMVDFRFSPDEQDNEKITPLMRAAQHSTNPDAFLFLLEYSSTPCLAATNGVTVEALLLKNDTLMQVDSTGRDLSPLEAYKEKCPQ